MRCCLTYQVVFILNFFFNVLLMKGISWLCTSPGRREELKFFLSTPYISLRSLRRKNGRPASSHLLLFLAFAIMTGITVSLARSFLLPLDYGRTLLLAPAVYFLTEAMGAFGQLFFSWSPVPTVPIHHHPLFSSSLGEFWGRNWNLWVQDWLKDVAQALGKGPGRRILVSFLVSGLFHEVMINLPYWLVYQKSYFGTMLLYFAFQSLGLWVDKRYMKGLPPLLRRSYLWIIVVLPSPLFINVPLLTFLGVYDG